MHLRERELRAGTEGSGKDRAKLGADDFDPAAAQIDSSYLPSAIIDSCRLVTESLFPVAEFSFIICHLSIIWFTVGANARNHSKDNQECASSKSD